jgi:hypothetical protein
VDDASIHQHTCVHISYIYPITVFLTLIIGETQNAAAAYASSSSSSSSRRLSLGEFSFQYIIYRDRSRSRGHRLHIHTLSLSLSHTHTHIGNDLRVTTLFFLIFFRRERSCWHRLLRSLLPAQGEKNYIYIYIYIYIAQLEHAITRTKAQLKRVL